MRRLNVPASDTVIAAQPEWPAALDVEQLLGAGWQPAPFRQFVLKFHSRCNLACDHCYVYELADQSWRIQPRTMSSAVISVTAERIAEHARAHRLSSVRIIFHGGEPLLAGTTALVDAAHKIRAAVDARVRVDYWVQTNGTLLDEKALDELEQCGIRVGVSLDGDSSSHDRNRQYPNGQQSYAIVTRAVEELMRRPSIYSGLLCVIDLAADPIGAYEAMLKFAPPVIDFLLPHGNWSAPPPGRPESDITPYADWLIPIFDRWYSAATRRTGIRLFDEIIHMILGGQSSTEQVGLTPSSVVVIESDGSIEQSDTLKSAYHGAAATGLHVVRDSFDAALLVPQVVATQLGSAGLGAECLGCAVLRICGGGMYAHRYRAGTGFRNRSVYCRDLYALIMHIKDQLVADLQLLPPLSYYQPV
jgi:uncharacterized protein